MALYWLIIFNCLLLSSALKDGKQDSQTSPSAICEIRKHGVHSIGSCLPDFVICDNGKAFVDKCQLGYLFDDADMLCKTPHEYFCSHLIPEDSERSCEGYVHASEAVQPADSHSKHSEGWETRFPVAEESLSRASGLPMDYMKDDEAAGSPVQMARHLQTDSPSKVSGLYVNNVKDVDAADSLVFSSRLFQSDPPSRASGLYVDYGKEDGTADSFELSKALHHDVPSKVSAIPHHHVQDAADEDASYVVPAQRLQPESPSRASRLLTNYLTNEETGEAVEPSKVFQPETFSKASSLSMDYEKNVGAEDSAIQASKVFQSDSFSKASGLYVDNGNEDGAADSSVQLSKSLHHDSPSKASGLYGNDVKDAHDADPVVYASRLFQHDSPAKASAIPHHHVQDAAAVDASYAIPAQILQPESPSKASSLSTKHLVNVETDDAAAVEPSKVFQPETFAKAASLSMDYMKNSGAEDSAIHASKVFQSDPLLKVSSLSTNYLKNAGAGDSAVEPSKVFEHDQLSKASDLSMDHLKNVGAEDSAVQASKVFQNDQLIKVSSLSKDHLKNVVAEDSDPQPSKLFQADSLSKASDIPHGHIQDVADASHGVSAQTLQPESLSKASELPMDYVKDDGSADSPVQLSRTFQSESLSKASQLPTKYLKKGETADTAVEQSQVLQPDQLSRASSLSMGHLKNVGVEDSAVQASKVFQSDQLSKASTFSNQYIKEVAASDAYVAPSQVFQRNSMPSKAASLSWNAGSRFHPQPAPIFEPLDKFDGQPSHLLLKNPFAHAEEGAQVNDRFDGEPGPQPLKTPFSAGAQESLVKDKFDGDVIPMLLNNPFAHFAGEEEYEDETHRPKYQRNAMLSEDFFGNNASGNGTTEEDEDLGHFWRRKRSINIKNCPVIQRSYRPIFRRFNVTTKAAVHTPNVRTVDSSLSPSPSSLREMFNNAPDVVSADPECFGRKDGYSYANGICRSTFHRCINGLKVRHNCAQTTQVFSERSNACVARSEEYECRPAKPSAISETEMKLNPTGLCEARMDGLYRHPNSCHRIIQCFGNDTFEHPPCAHGLAFDERRGVCDYRQNVPGCLEPANDASSKPSTVVGCGGAKHGDHLRNEKDCGSFYRCVWDILELMKCPEGTVFNAAISVCDHPNQVKGC